MDPTTAFATMPRRFAPSHLAAALLLAMAANGFAAPARKSAAVPADPDLQASQLNADRSTPQLGPGSRGTAVVRAQVLLDRMWFSPGEIDGIYSRNTAHSVAAFQRSRGLRPTGHVDASTWAALAQDPAPVFATYTVAAADVAGPFGPMPQDPVLLARLPRLGYQSALEAFAERYHSSPKLLVSLNRGRKLEAGAQLVVPAIAQRAQQEPAAALRIDKSDRMLYALGRDGRLLAAFPVSFGGQKDPLPLGRMKITSEQRNPPFTYDPALLRNPRTGTRVELPPGPNSPVGLMWLGLSRPHWGIHGTDEPAQAARVQTNGCVRLTNWDVLRLSGIVDPGTPVDVQG